MRFLLLLCLLYWSFQCVSVREIFISEKGSDTPSCLERNNPLVSCRSLVNVSKHVTSYKLNNIVIVINDTNYTLQGVANFSGVENITLTGKEDNSMTEITCNSSNIFDTGIAFDHSAVIILKSFTISHCGATIFSPKNLNFLTGNGTAIQIINCNRVNITGIVVYMSISQGLTFINTGSTVRVIDSYFINNTVSQSQWFGNGALQVVFLGEKNLSMNADYSIVNSKFINNGYSVSNRVTKQNPVDSKYCERGGGIRILILNYFYKHCSIKLENNTLEGNYAVYGGGAFIYVSGNTSNSMIKILNSYFIANTVSADGGGLEISYSTHKTFYPINNTCIVLSSSFISNTATNGGGLSTYSSSIEHIKRYNTLKCIKCRFERNSARCGSAVSVTRGLFSKDGSKNINWVYFIECVFRSNVVIFKIFIMLFDVFPLT